MNRLDPPSLTELADLLGARLESDSAELATQSVHTVASSQRPVAGAVVVLDGADDAVLEQLEAAGVVAVVVEDALEVTTTVPRLRVDDTRLALAALTARFRPPLAEPAISPHATIAPSAHLADDVAVAAGAVIEADVVIGRRTRIGAGSVVCRGTQIGEEAVLHANVTLYPEVVLGDRVVIQSGAVIGADGFGYAFGTQGAVRIHHLGRVVLEDDVEVGANSCIDRGTLDDTRIGARSKVDNLCDIAHNVTTGHDCLILGATVIAGSVTLGDRVIVGGGSVLRDHISLGDDARLVGNAGLGKSIPAGETWSGSPAQPFRRWTRQLYLLGQLERIWQTVRRWEKRDEDGS